MQYNWQQKDWPNFTYSVRGLEEKLYAYAEGQGLLTGMIEALPEQEGQNAIIDIIVAEALKTSEIEGEYISRQDVLSSVRNNLGLNPKPEKIRDQRALGVAHLMVHVRENHSDPLSTSLLFEWHDMLMESYMNINIGKWRTSEDAMRIISGPIGKEIVHFEAPPSKQVPGEMLAYIKWYNSIEWSDQANKFKAPVLSGIAHSYFESIHPFEDGNGRIGRAISEKMLSQAQNQPILFSISKSIEKDKSKYYQALKKAQSSNHIDAWIRYYMDLVLEAQKDAVEQIQFTIFKTKFFDRVSSLINNRQKKVLKKMLSSPVPFEGGMNTKKYVSLTRVSRATASRDLQELAKQGILVAMGGGRSTRYYINEGF